MNKTFLFNAHAPYTAGAILVVADSVQEVKDFFLDYFKKYKEALKDDPFYIKRKYSSEHSSEEWGKIVYAYHDAEEKFIKEFQEANPNFSAVSTGTVYDDTGNFIKEINIVEKFEDLGEKNGWYVVKEFYSDLPKGFHYVEDYMA